MAGAEASAGLAPALDADKAFFRALAALALALLFAFAGMPLLFVFAKSLATAPGAPLLANFAEAFAAPRFWIAVRNSLVVSITVTGVCVALGFLFAYTLAKYDVPLKGPLRLVVDLPIFAPSLVLGLGIVFLLGRNGLVSRSLGIDLHIYGFWGIVLADTLYCLPQVVMVLTATLARMDARPYEAATVLGASSWKAFTSVTLPASRFGLANAALLAFTITITDFGNAVVVGGDYAVLATEIYKQVSGQMNFGLGSVIAIVLMVPAALAYAAGRWVSRRQVAAISDQAQPLAPVRPGAGGWVLYGCVLLIVAVVGAVTAIVLVASFVKLWPYNFTLTLKHYSLDIPGGFDSLGNSIKVALATALFGTAAVLSSALLAEKWKHPLARVIHGLAVAPAAIPGMVLGLAYVFTFNDPANPLGFLYGTLAIIVACNICHYHAQGYLTAVTALKQLSGTFDEASATLGASFLQTFRWVLWPILLPAVAAIASFFFMRSMVTLSAVIFLVTPATTLAPVAVLQLDDAGYTSQAAALSECLIAVVLVSIGASKAVAALVRRQARSARAP